MPNRGTLFGPGGSRRCESALSQRKNTASDIAKRAALAHAATWRDEFMVEWWARIGPHTAYEGIRRRSSKYRAPDTRTCSQARKGKGEAYIVLVGSLIQLRRVYGRVIEDAGGESLCPYAVTGCMDDCIGQRSYLMPDAKTIAICDKCRFPFHPISVSSINLKWKAAEELRKAVSMFLLCLRPRSRHSLTGRGFNG